MMADLKERYGFELWGGRDAQQLIRKPLPDLTTVGLRFESRAAISGERHGFIDFYQTADGDGRVAVTIVEHHSVAAAHEALLHILALVMAPQLPSCEEQGLNAGDACFCAPGDVVDKVFFVRRNILVRVESAGRERFDVREIAAAADERLSETVRA